MRGIGQSQDVVDASLALTWVMDERHSTEARHLLGARVETRVIVTAPTLLARPAERRWREKGLVGIDGNAPDSGWE